jgi:hypothetical protein
VIFSAAGNYRFIQQALIGNITERYAIEIKLIDKSADKDITILTLNKLKMKSPE